MHSKKAPPFPKEWGTWGKQLGGEGSKAGQHSGVGSTPPPPEELPSSLVKMQVLLSGDVWVPTLPQGLQFLSSGQLLETEAGNCTQHQSKVEVWPLMRSERIPAVRVYHGGTQAVGLLPAPRLLGRLWPQWPKAVPGKSS